MKKKCSYCLGLKAFCILKPSNYGKDNLLFSYDNWTFGEYKQKLTLCSSYLSGKLSPNCAIFGCASVCPICKGVGEIEWIDEFFKYNTYGPSKEDFRRLKGYFLGDGRNKHKLKNSFIEYLREEKDE